MYHFHVHFKRWLWALPAKENSSLCKGEGKRETAAQHRQASKLAVTECTLWRFHNVWTRFTVYSPATPPGWCFSEGGGYHGSEVTDRKMWNLGLDYCVNHPTWPSRIPDRWQTGHEICDYYQGKSLTFSVGIIIVRLKRKGFSLQHKLLSWCHFATSISAFWMSLQFLLWIKLYHWKHPSVMHRQWLTISITLKWSVQRKIIWM